MEPTRLSDAESLRQLAEWLESVEGERLEFKEAKDQYSADKLAQYLCAFANEGGGRVVLGVTDQRPRRVVGSAAFQQLERTRATLLAKLPVRVDVQELHHPEGRVVVFEVAGRPRGTPLQVDGKYWSRGPHGGDSLTTLDQDRLRLIFAETGRDFSAETCPGATMADLDPAAIEIFRARWIEKSGSARLQGLTAPQLLRDAALLDGDRICYAALVLFGTREALGRHLPQAEIVCEYRSSEAAGPATDREEYRAGFLAVADELWRRINARNDKQHFRDGLFVREIATFDEGSVREAVLNAVCHRDYQMHGSVFVRQYARRLVVESPGGLPAGVTIANVLDCQAPRNRRIAEALQRCGLVERAGQGMNLMFEHSLRQGKRCPDLAGTDSWHVVLTLHGDVQDVQFLRFLERVGMEKQVSFSTADLLVLDRLHRDQEVPEELRDNLRRLRVAGVVESIGRGAGTRYLLSRSLYQAAGRGGVYTRRRGLDDETNKELLVAHLRTAGEHGSRIADLQQVLPMLARSKVRRLLQELEREGRVHLRGARRGARWRLGPKAV